MSEHQPYAVCQKKECGKAQGALVGFTGAKRRACTFCGYRRLGFAMPYGDSKVFYG